MLEERDSHHSRGEEEERRNGRDTVDNREEKGRGQ